MSKSSPSRRFVVSGAVALAGVAGKAVALAAPAVTVTEHVGAVAGAWAGHGQFEAFRRQYIDGRKIRYVVARSGDVGFTVSRGGQVARVGAGAQLGAAVAAALAA